MEDGVTTPPAGFGYVQDWSAQNFVQDVCGQFQPCTSGQTNPTPGLTDPTPSPNHNPPPCVFWWRFSIFFPGGRKASLDQ